MPQVAAQDFIVKVVDAIASRKYAEAAALCSEGMRCYPENLRLKIQHGIILRCAGEQSAARVHYLGLLESYPSIAELEFKLAEIAIADRDTREAERRIEAARAKGGLRRIALLLRSSLARHAGDEQGECALLESVLEEADALPVIIAVRLAAVYSQLKDHAKAHALLLRVLDVAPDNITAHSVLAGVAMAMGDGVLAERAVLRLIELDPDRPEWYARAQRIYLHLGRVDKTEEILRAGLARGLAGELLFGLLPALPPIADLADQVLRWAKGVGDAASKSERTLAQDVLFHYAQATFTARPGAGERITNHQPTDSDLLALSPADKDLKRPVTLEQVNAEVQVSRSSTSDCVVLVFLGLGNKAMLPIGIFDRFFAQLDCSVMYLRDNRRLLGNAGIASLGKTFEDTACHLQSMVTELRGQRCITVGSSAGGYPALRYGLRLGAEKILCFSGPTNITAEFLVNDGRGSIIARRVQALPREVLDMKPHVLAAKGRAAIHMVYGAEHPQDKMHALHLQGCPGVHLHPLRGLKEHGSILALAKQRSLLSTLRTVIEGQGGV